MTEHHIPVLAAGVPVFHDPLRGKIEHPAQGIVIGKRGLVLRDLPKLAIQPLNDVRRVYDLPNLQRIFKEGTQNLPVFFPAFDTGRIPATPALTEGQKLFLRLIQRHGGVNLLQVCHDLLDILVADIAGGRPDLMDDAALANGFQETQPGSPASSRTGRPYRTDIHPLRPGF